MIPRKITIEPVLNGYLVKVGCQSLVFPTATHLLDQLRSYLNNPANVERDYIENALHREMVHCPQESAPAPGVLFNAQTVAAEIRRDYARPEPPPMPQAEQCETSGIGAELAERRMQPRGPERAG